MFIQSHFMDNSINILILNLLIVIIGLCILNYYSTKLLITIILNFRYIDREEVNHLSNYL